MAFGAAGDLIDYCTLYGRISCISLTAFMLQNVFQSFFVAGGKTPLGLKDMESLWLPVVQTLFSMPCSSMYYTLELQAPRSQP